MAQQRGTTWQGYVTHRGQKFRKGGFVTQAEALAWEAQVRADIAAGRTPNAAHTGPNGCPTMRDLLDRVKTVVWAGTKSEADSVRNASEVVAMLGPETPPSRVSAASLDAVVARLLEKGVTNATINRKMAAVSRMLTFAKDRGWIAAVPRIPRRKETEHRIRYLSPEEEATVLAHLDALAKFEMKDLVVLLIDTGLRLSEGLGLKWDDVRDGSVRVWGSGAKSGKSRTVPMTDRVRAMVERRFAGRGEEDRVFPGLSLNSVEYVWGIVRERMKLDKDPQFVLHALRHTFATRLVQSGVHVLTLQALLGHATIAMTMRYAHVADTQRVDAINLLNRKTA